MNILYCGQLWHGSTAVMRRDAMLELGHHVVSVPVTPERAPTGLRSFVARVMHKLKRPLDLAGANAKLRAEAENGRFDVFWIDKGLTIHPKTIRQARARQPRIRVAGYSPDDMANPQNQSVYFLRGLPLYDYYFTTKTFGVAELRRLGVPQPVFNGNAYDRNTHFPMELTAAETEKFGCDVGFIGAFEQDRADQIAFLATRGVGVRIFGDGWARFAATGKLLAPPQPGVWSLDYTRAICGAKINLCFLRKVNRDLQTQRSVEIPACQGFMLAERTAEHQELFKEGVEAEYFSSPQELLDKVQFYLWHEDARQRIAAAGRQRCLDSGYSYHDRMAEALRLVFPPSP